MRTEAEWFEKLDRRVALMKKTGTWEKIERLYEFDAPTEKLARIDWRNHPRYRDKKRPA